MLKPEYATAYCLYSQYQFSWIKRLCNKSVCTNFQKIEFNSSIDPGCHNNNPNGRTTRDLRCYLITLNIRQSQIEDHHNGVSPQLFYIIKSCLASGNAKRLITKSSPERLFDFRHHQRVVLNY